MSSKEELKQRVCEIIDQRAEDIITISQTILNNPEPGFLEQETAKLVQSEFDKLELPHKDNLAITGVKSWLDCGNPGPTIAVIGELDSLRVFDHPHANPLTGAAHACGHHAQIGMMLGSAMGLRLSGVTNELSGKLVFFAVPAEELIDIDFRNKLRQEKKIEFLGGKQELVKLGEFDDIDLAMMTHTTSGPESLVEMSSTNNGLVVKQIKYFGKAAHAGGSPHLGINALNAANLGIQGINALRETFKDSDTIRVHPIITRGGDAVSSVPSEVHMETYVRGSNVEAIARWSDKVDNALKAGALAIGANVEIITIPGYLPLNNNASLAAIYEKNANDIVGKENVNHIGHRTGSTDMGDLSQIIPTIHPYTGGVSGVGHGSDYVVYDYETSVINPAKIMAMSIIDLLYNNATKAKEIVSTSKLPLTKKQYLNTLRKLATTENWEGNML
jgi:amidohydrolase